MPDLVFAEGSGILCLGILYTCLDGESIFTRCAFSPGVDAEIPVSYLTATLPAHRLMTHPLYWLPAKAVISGSAGTILHYLSDLQA